MTDINTVNIKQKSGTRYFTSKLAKLLVIPLTLVLIGLFGKMIQDANNYFAPYAPDNVYKTEAYKKLENNNTNKYPFKINTKEAIAMENLRTEFKINHESDQTKSLIISSIISAFFWVIALLIHLSLGNERQQFRILTIPYYFTSGLLLLTLFANILSILFSKSAMFGLYFSLGIIIVLLTGGVVVYLQKQQSQVSKINNNQ